MNQENLPPNANSTEEHQVLEEAPSSEIIQDISQAIAQEQDHPAPTAVSTADFEEFLKTLRGCHEPEKKLEMSIQFMQQRLAQTGIPHFKEFWDARRVCLDLFKENINPSVRVALWARYSELCRQARKLKEIFDEQSAFAAEQIEIAVVAIEADVERFSELLEKMAGVDFGIECHSLKDHFAEYNASQRELNLLNAYAMKTSALRKELIKTEMRIRQKNKFFERLSKLGDSIFPRRKELIQKVSDLFISDVERFITTTFVSELNTAELFNVRDEIKALQSIAKVLTLNTESFSQTRQRLSECWDSVKNVVKDRRKVATEQKSEYKKHRDEFVQELEELKVKFEAKELTTANVDSKLDDIVHRMRKTPLGKFEIRELRDKVREIRQVVSAQAHTEDQSRRFELQKREQEKQARLEKLSGDLRALCENCPKLEIEALESQLEPLSKEVASCVATRSQKQELEKQLRHLRDLISEKKEQKLLNLSDDDRHAISQLKELLKERKKHRQEIKQQLEVWRKESGSSGMDISQAMQYNELIAHEKTRLEKVEAGIEEIEDKIDKLQG